MDYLPTLAEKMVTFKGKWLGRYSHPMKHLGYIYIIYIYTYTYIYILHITYIPYIYPLKPWLALAAAPRNLPKHRRSATWRKPATPRPLQRLGYYCAGWLQRTGCHPGCCFRKKDANLEQKMHRFCCKSAIC